jgi:hypothetical protein
MAKLIKSKAGQTFIRSTTPCIDCGKLVKFTLVPEVALMLTADFALCDKCEPRQKPGSIVMRYFQ